MEAHRRQASTPVVRELEWHVYSASKTERKTKGPRVGGKKKRAKPAVPAQPDGGDDVVVQTSKSNKRQVNRVKQSVNSTTIKYKWSFYDPDLYVNSMVLAGDRLFIAGPPAVRNDTSPEALANWQGRNGGVLWCLSAAEGKKLSELKLPSPPVYEGMAAAGGNLYLSLCDGTIVCLKKESK